MNHEDTKSRSIHEGKENVMGYGDVLDVGTERIATEIVDSAFRVHTTLGPGLLESVYVQCLVIELEMRGLTVRREVDVPIEYRGRRVLPGLRMDLLVNELVVVEAKAIEALNAIHSVKTKTYCKLSGKRLGILINFNVALIKDGIKRIIL